MNPQARRAEALVEVPQAQGYAATVASIHVHKIGDNPIFSEGLTTVRLEDEAGGCFVVLQQETDEHSTQAIRLDFDEVEMVVQAIATLRAQNTVAETLKDG